MRVLIVHNAGDSTLPSGELAVARAEAEALCKRGVTVHLHVVNNDSVRHLFSFNTLIAGLNIFWSYSSFRRTKKLLEKYKPDIVHFHGVLPLLTPSAFHAMHTKLRVAGCISRMFQGIKVDKFSSMGGQSFLQKIGFAL
jgi:hypothetical protein